MSIFTNPAASSKEQAKDYIQGVLDKLGSRDPIKVLEQTPASLKQAFSGLTGKQQKTPEKPGKWSCNKVLQHLADSEIVLGYRLRMILAQDRPQLTGYDQDRWAERLQYEKADPNQALEEFSTLRRGNLYLLARMNRDDLKRIGLHAERGEESVEHMIRLYAGHDLIHLQQLKRIRETITEV